MAKAKAKAETAKKNEAAASSAIIYLDVSTSMAGFVTTQPAKKPGKKPAKLPVGFAIEPAPYSDLLVGLPQALSTLGAGVATKKFGSGISDLGTIDVATKPEIYNENTSAIGEVLKAVAKEPATSVSVVVTDLFLSMDQITGTSQAAIAAPLADSLSLGRSIGLLALRSRFTGKIFDLPSGGSYPEDGVIARPVFFLIIGPDPAVTAVFETLKARYLAALSKDAWNFSLFSPEMVRQTVVLTSSGKWASATAKSAQVHSVDEVSPMAIEAMDKNNPISWSASFPTDLSFHPYGLRVREALTHTTHTTNSSLADGAHCSWRPLQTTQPPVTASIPKSGTVSLTLNRINLTPGQFYFVHGSVVAGGLDEDSPALAWMKEGMIDPATGAWSGWSFNAATERALVKTRPPFFPTVNLHALGQTLAQVAYREFSLRSTPLAGFDLVFRKD